MKAVVDSKIPYAPHSPSATVFNDGTECYFVLDGRRVPEDDDEVSVLIEALTQKASDVLGGDAAENGGFWAGDFFCGRVLIVYFKRTDQQQEQEQEQEDKG